MQIRKKKTSTLVIPSDEFLLTVQKHSNTVKL